jgi:hypothetical protein
MRCFREETASRTGLVWLVLLAGAVGRMESAPAPFPRRAGPEARLLAVLDENARWASGLMRCSVDIDVREGKQAIGLSGQLAFERGGRYRLQGKVLGQLAIDMGSNKQEAWVHLPTAGHSFHLVRAGQRGGAGKKTSWIFPFHPGWLPAALGLVEPRRVRNYKVVPRADGVELVEEAVDPAGVPVRKVRVVRQSGERPRVVGFRLEDIRGRVILTCSIVDFRPDANGRLVVPVRVKVQWPGKNIQVVLRLNGLQRVAALGGRVFQAPPGK